MMSAAARRGTTARRILVAFSTVLGLFALALVVMLIALHEVGDAEREVARLDHAKHAGHHAAAMARAQYIHQAHTLLEWNDTHLHHYDEVAAEARAATARLLEQVDSVQTRRQAAEIEALVAESDRRFREEVMPAVAAGDRTQVGTLHLRTEAPVEHVVAIAEQLNQHLEARSGAAQARAERIRGMVRLAVIGCFGLAILLAAAVGLWLLRSISRPVAVLREGARRVGRGDLGVQIPLPGDDELGDLARVFNQMTSDLSQRQVELLEAHRLASIGQVASGVAHEINNPLGVIWGYVKLLRREPAFSEREELGIIEDEVRQCQVIVTGLLDLARPVRLALGEVELGGLVREAIARLDERSRDDQVQIRVSAESALLHVHGDEDKLRQIVLNLLLNAIDAARAGDANVGVEVSWSLLGDCARVVVRDHGLGIPTEIRSRLFEPFFTTKATGHGLGLAIAQTLARAHEGEITLEPAEDGPGTCAVLRLPVTGPVATGAA